MSSKYYSNKRVLITAGPTREYIDPVRYISNESSGKMGYALAEAATGMGAEVTLISGPAGLKRPKVSRLILVASAREMYRAAMAEYKRADIIICAAAVSDFRPRRRLKRKIKRGSELTIELTENPDILMTIGRRRRSAQILVGFALETENLTGNATKKLRGKNCDMIIANYSNAIGKDKTSIRIIRKDGKTTSLSNKSKRAAAGIILREIASPETKKQSSPT